MTAKSDLGNHAETGVLIGAIGLFSFAFLRAEDMLISIACVVAVLGWVGWWYERSSEEQESFAADDSPGEAIHEPAAEAVAENEATITQTQTKKNLFSNLFKRSKIEQGNNLDSPIIDHAVLSAEIEGDVGEIAHQIMTARVEAELAVNTAIESFSVLVNEANQIEECSQEVASWQHDSNPMHEETVKFLLERSTDLGKSVSKLVMAFQFNDLLSQRLTHTEKSLYHITARLRGEETEGIQKSPSFAAGPVNYEVEQQDDNQVTLF